MAEYLALGHMREVSNSSLAKCFLPHHGVLKTNTPTPKLRVVFNGSARNRGGLWRLYKFVFTTDVEKMFRQIPVHPDDQTFQAILRASRILREEFYVDDCLSGGHSVEEASIKCEELTELARLGGFPLRKWSSNSPQALACVPLDHRVDQPKTLQENPEAISVLGLSWDLQTDEFAFKFTVDEFPNLWTKRTLFAQTARLFDPLGWFSLVIIVPKMLLQSLWLLKISWDTPLPDSVVEPWVRWLSEIPQLNQVRIPRWNFYSPSIRLEIHGFADASKSAYAAVVYTRVVVENVVHVSLQIAKTRVAPLKVLSIPRLELCGAHLLAKVVRHFTDCCPCDGVPIHLKTDSLNVLHWLNAPVFVANRCSDIHHLMPSVKWHHISSKQNPADLASRGILPSQLIAKQLWFHGPDVLHETDPQYPDLKLEVIEPSPSFNLVASCSKKEPDSFVTSLLSRCSHWFRLTRVMAYVLRFAYRCLGRLRQSSLTTSIQSTDLSFIKREAFARYIYSSLTTIELESASLLLIFDHQQRHFAQDIAVLKRNANLPISQQEHLPASSR
ncbi:uncharacterized protein LOC106644640 [Copidosoma floridanum]|uniref:uncharacterized protein LOC106644640 n=1 Tax=Copidosoma floridanum TaxID=29053 RepID=UPI0006C9C7EB|nr:uncharacterized protein LOC106644640 [Copidosoma floridanum]